MVKEHAAYQPMPLEVTGYGRFTSPDRPGWIRPYVEGRFTRNPDFTFEIGCVDKPSQDTYEGTRIYFMLIKVDGVTVWAWSAPMDDDGDSYRWYMSNESLVADILANLDVIYAHVDLPFAVEWRDLAGQSHSKRFATDNALRAFLAERPHDWKELLSISRLEDDQTRH